MTKKKKNNIKPWKVYAAVAVLLIVVTAVAIHRSWRLPLRQEVRIYIPTGSTYEAVVDTLVAYQCISGRAMFGTMARMCRYQDNVKSGSYRIVPGMDMVQLVKKLSRGNQDAVTVTIGKHRTVETLCAFLGSKLEVSGDTLLRMMKTDSVAEYYGYTVENFPCMFLCNTYELYWNSTAKRLFDRMERESERFWNDRRMNQCKSLGLTPAEVITLASIVEEETNNNKEKDTIASVYLNRLRKGMLLQADPTLKFSVGDFSLRRLGREQILHESPYNTYRHKGLPPGPICLPSVESIEAVLENLPTGYLYFCAKEDFSGSHRFAATLAQHNANAARFHRALNERNIH